MPDSPIPATSVSAIRADFLDAARAAVDAVTSAEVRARWDDPSALPRMSVGELAAHLARAVVLVSDFLDQPDPHRPETVDVETYFGTLTGSDDLDSELNSGVRERSRQGAADGPDALTTRLRAALTTVTQRLRTETAERQVTVFGGHAMLLDDYLPTRLVEIAVHLDDLGFTPPDAVCSAAVEVLLRVARRRHQDLAVLRALARRERDERQALRVF